MRFTDRTAIVTGGASGIGIAVAARLAQDGVNIILADLDAERLDAASSSLKEATGASATQFVGDLSSEAGAAKLIEYAVATAGKVDILINNAGGGVILPTLAHTEQTLQATVDRNLWTMLRCTRALLPHLIANGYGRVVSVGAESVRNGLWQHAIYNAAKGGVHGMTTGLAREFATNGITVNVVAPAYTMTPELEHKLAIAQGSEKEALAAFDQQIVASIPAGRAGTVEEVAAVVAFVASDEASYVTGQVISVNGGSSML